MLTQTQLLLRLMIMSFLVLERDGKFLKDDPNIMKHVYRIDLKDATNLEDIATQGDLVQDPKLGLTIARKNPQQYFINNDKNGSITSTKHSTSK